MRRLTLAAPALLAACAATSPPQATPVHGVTPGHTCDAKRTDSFIGRTGSQATGAAIKRATKAAVLRWSPPNTMLTMDYREDRVTVWLDENKKITKVRCG
ncbi:MAG: I78 family peptidase inhibitor [Sphingomonas sp.]